MVFYSMKLYTLMGYQKSKHRNKKYDAIISSNVNGKRIEIPFGDIRYSNYGDKTRLNLYSNLVTGDENRRRLYRIRHEKDLRTGYFSPGYFSYHILW